MPADPPVPASPRERLAHIALEAASAAPGVVGLLGGGGRWSTSTATGRIEGVACAAGPDGYDVALRVCAAPVDLRATGAALRESVLRRAEAAGLRDAVGRVDVEIADVALGEPAAPEPAAP